MMSFTKPRILLALSCTAGLIGLGLGLSTVETQGQGSPLLAVANASPAANEDPLEPDDASERACLDRCEGQNLAAGAAATCRLNCTATDEDLFDTTPPTVIERIDACTMSCDARALTAVERAACDADCVEVEPLSVTPCTEQCAMNFVVCERSCDTLDDGYGSCELGCNMAAEACSTLCPFVLPSN